MRANFLISGCSQLEFLVIGQRKSSVQPEHPSNTNARYGPNAWVMEAQTVGLLVCFNTAQGQDTTIL